MNDAEENGDLDSPQTPFGTGVLDMGWMLASLFETRDRYVEIHREVFGGSLTALLRAIKMKRPPLYGQLASELGTMAVLLEIVSPHLVLNERHLPDGQLGLATYCESIKDAVLLFQRLLDETATVGVANVADQTLARYQVAAIQFGAIGESLRP